jgi:hypothetical protein
MFEEYKMLLQFVEVIKTGLQARRKLTSDASDEAVTGLLIPPVGVVIVGVAALLLAAAFTLFLPRTITVNVFFQTNSPSTHSETADSSYF